MKKILVWLSFTLLLFAGKFTYGQEKDLQISLNSALKSISDGDFIKAKTALDSVLLADSNHSRAYSLRGWIQHKIGELDSAKMDFDKALKTDPANASAWFYLGDLESQRRQYEQAIIAYSQVVKLRPNSAKAYATRALSYLAIENHDAALSDYNIAIQKSPEADLYDSRGALHLELGNYTAALNDFRAAIKLDDKSAGYYLNSFSALSRMRSFQTLAALEQTFREKFKSDSLQIDYRGNVSRAIVNGQFKIALDSLVSQERQLKNNDWQSGSNYTELLSLKGYLLEKLKDQETAKQVYMQALALHQNQPEVTASLIAINQAKQVVAKQDVTPPSISLITPESERGLKVISINDMDIQIVGRATDPSGITSVTVNGLHVKPEEDGLFTTTIKGKQGLNNIIITALDAMGNKASKTFPLNVTIQSLAVAEKPIVPVQTVTNELPKYHAILIAGNQYNDPNIENLQNPIKDAKDLRNILISNYTFESKNIDTIFNGSREKIMEAIALKCNSLTSNDNLIIFYAGHGIAERDQFNNVDGYWIPSSAKFGVTSSYVSSDDINRTIKRSNSKHILLIADACFSGSFTRSLAPDASMGIQKQYDLPSRKIMASGNMEPVPDNSIFIKYLKRNLLENKEKYLTAKKLFDGFYEAVLNNSDTSPQFAAIKNVGDEGGQFIFIKK